MSVQLRSLRVFCDIVDLRSFTAAGDEHGLSQSAVSQLVQHLEERLGTTLIDRSRRPFVLTEEGQTYYEGCRRIAREYEQLEDQVRCLHGSLAGRLNVAAIYSVGLAHMQRYVQQFRTEYPAADVRLDYLHPERVYEVVEKGDAELGLVSFHQGSRSLEAIPWRQEAIALVCSPGHRLAAEPQSKLAQLDGEALVGFERGLRIRDEIDRALMRAKVHVQREHEFDNIETIKRAVEINAGVALLPLPTVEREVAIGALVAVPLDGESLVRPLEIIHRRHGEMTSVAKQFVDMLTSDERNDGGAKSREEGSSLIESAGAR